ncbi:hypothetical protein [Flammeovirga sp. SJP92]|uniref:hypothetical protein n=1 Tax=Flammeovirga sp. SJP92 TaxID=1775430 RepID=UPI000788D6D7|nr:hypothetical protein [Flammeovirga sp. SJP92]KXX67806.1 hypothetical protein AVL50_25425 [Flammeovirga sp. SJP92]
MNIFETRRSDGFIISLKSFLSKKLILEGLKQNISLYLENDLSILFGAVIFLPFTLLIGLPAFILGVVAIIAYPIYKYTSLSRKTALVTIAISSQNIIVKSKLFNYDFKVVFYPNELEQLFVLEEEGNSFCLYFIIESNRERFKYPIMLGDKEKLPEYHDVIKAIHDYYNIHTAGLIGAVELEEKVQPKRKREYFKIFDQEVEDIRRNGVITVLGNDYYISDDEQIDWINGLSSYRFKMDDNLFLYYQPSLTDQLFIKEKNVSYIYDLELYSFDDELVDIQPSLTINGITYYHRDSNEGEYFVNNQLTDEVLHQVMYEDESRENFLRFYTVNRRLQTAMGSTVQEHQLQEFLPEIE